MLSVSSTHLSSAVRGADRRSGQALEEKTMFADSQLEFSTQQALSGAGTIVSSNIVDGTAARLWAGGTPMECYLSFCGVAPGGTSPTFTATLFEADDSAFSVNKTALGAVTVPLASGVPVVDTWALSIGTRVPRRFLRVEYALGGTSPTATVTCGFVRDLQTNPPPIGA
jgi:hypothetical protein